MQEIAKACRVCLFGWACRCVLNAAAALRLLMDASKTVDDEYLTILHATRACLGPMPVCLRGLASDAPLPRPRPDTHSRSLTGGRLITDTCARYAAAESNRRDPHGLFLRGSLGICISTLQTGACTSTSYLRTCFGECLYLEALPQDCRYFPSVRLARLSHPSCLAFLYYYPALMSIDPSLISSISF
jgi:hypothetical protein